jgi:hypothetical protein
MGRTKEVVNPFTGKIDKTYQGVTNIEDYFTTLGIVKSGLAITPNANLTFGVESGFLRFYNSETDAIDTVNIPTIATATFDIISLDGTILATGSNVDFSDVNINGVATIVELPQNNDASFIEIFINKDADIKVLIGQQIYTTINVARQSFFSETKVLPSILDGYIKIGGFLGRKDATNLSAANVYPVATSKLGEIQLSGGSSSSSELLKEPVLDVAELKTVLAPLEGETRQITSELPSVVFYTFNETAATGETANDGTTGYWNILESSEVPVEPLETVLFANTSLGHNTTTQLDNGLTWQEAKDTYEKLIAYIYFPSSDYSYSPIVMLTENMQTTGNDFAQSHGTSSDFFLQNIDLADGDFTTNSSFSGTFSVKIVGVKSQQTVVMPDVLPTAPQTAWSDGDHGVWNASSNRFEPTTLPTIEFETWTTQLDVLINADSETSTGTGSGQIKASDVYKEEIKSGLLTKVTLTGKLTNWQEDDNITINLSTIMSVISSTNINELNGANEYGSTTAARISGTTWTLNRDNGISGNSPVTFQIVGYK